MDQKMKFRLEVTDTVVVWGYKEEGISWEYDSYEIIQIQLVNSDEIEIYTKSNGIYDRFTLTKVKGNIEVAEGNAFGTPNNGITDFSELEWGDSEPDTMTLCE
jgi:hypothetical protein